MTSPTTCPFVPAPFLKGRPGPHSECYACGLPKRLHDDACGESPRLGGPADGFSCQRSSGHTGDHRANGVTWPA